MMDLLEIWIFLESVWPQILGVTIALIAIYKGAIGSGARILSMTDRQRNSSCKSPDCVRCRGYTVTMSKFLKEWRYYIDEQSRSNVEKLDRLCVSVENLKDVSSPEFQPTFEMAGLSQRPIHEPAAFSVDIRTLESNFDSILREYQRISRSDRGWLVNTTPTGKWKAYFLINQGSRIEENIKHCPMATRVIGTLENVMTDCVFGNVCYSVVSPGTHITEHYGPCNLRVRCHLGLEVPSECELTVDGVKYQWQRGKCLLFDDSYLHSVMHTGVSSKGSISRAILLIDFWSPEITRIERTALTKLLHASKAT